MSITVVSTTDSPENVQAASGAKAQDPKPKEGGKESAPAASAAEQNDTEDSETPETEASDAEPAEPEESSDEGDEAEEAGKQKAKKKGGFQRRIDKLNARVTERERELEYWKQQALKASQTPGEPKPAAQQPQAPKPAEGKPNPDDFESYGQYSEALANWVADQKFKDFESRQHQTKLEAERKQLESAHFDRVKTFQKGHEDFQEVLSEVDDIMIAPTLEQVITTSELGPEIIYDLAKNRAELERINALPPLAMARELGKLEYRLKSAAAPSDAGKNKQSNAPAPVKPVGTKGKSAGKSIYDSDLTQDEYEALRRKQRSA